MNELLTAAREMQDFFHSRDWPFAFIGGLAVLRWGEPRFTRDVDLTLFTGFENEEDYIREILENFTARRPDMQTFATQYRVVLIFTANHIPVDIALGGLPFEEAMIRNSSFYEFDEDYTLNTCSAQDLIVMKSFADRDRDWVDVQGIVTRQQDSLDWSYILSQLEPLCALKDAPHILKKLQEIKNGTRTDS